MKRFISLLVCFIFAIFGAGCSNWKDVEKTAPAFSKVWTAVDAAVTHEKGGIAVDDGWGALLTETSGSLCRVSDLSVKKSAYTVVARLLAKKTGNSKIVAAVLRALNENGVEIGRLNIREEDFTSDMNYQEFECTFDLPSDQKMSVDIYWPGSTYVRVSEFGIASRGQDKLPDFTVDGKAFLGVDAEENAFEQTESNLYYFDLLSYMDTLPHSEAQYDIANLVSTLQGLVNRDVPKLFVRFQQENKFCDDTDSYWLDYLSQSGRMLADKTTVEIKNPITLLKIFNNYYTGFAAWDSNVPATVNAAATACGVENLLPVRYSTVKNSLYYYITASDEFAAKPVKYNLGGMFTGEGTIPDTQTPSTGSRKNDVYLWAKANFLDTKKTNPHLMAYHVDAYSLDRVFANYADLQNMYLSNRDYYTANKCFFFDLSVLPDYLPNDDPDQADESFVPGYDESEDYLTFNKIMKEQNTYAASVNADKPVDIGGFTPWHLKYTRYTDPNAPGDVDVEWATVDAFSAYFAYVNADAPSFTAMANASVYMHFKMKTEGYTQKGSKAAKESLPAASEKGVNYLMFFMGDFDASSWLNTAMINMWNDSKRGELPLCWTFSLELYKRAGHVIDMMYNTATTNDYFVSGANGVGYLNPEVLTRPVSAPNNGSLEKWANYNKTAYDYFDIDFSGHLITVGSASKTVIEAYKTFSKGAATNFTYTGGKVEGFTTASSRDFSSVNEMLSGFANKNTGSGSSFTQIRFILRNPTEIYDIYQEFLSHSEKNFKLVDPYTFYALAAQNA